MGAEGLILTLPGVVFGAVAAPAGIVPFTVVRTDQVLPGEVSGIGARRSPSRRRRWARAW